MLKSKSFISNMLLVLAAAIWGINYAVVKSIANSIGPFTYISMRILLGAVTLLIIILFMESKEEKRRIIRDKAYLKKLLSLAPWMGVINVSGTLLMQFGMIYTTASRAGFIGAIYIVLVPIVGWLFFKLKTNANTLIGIVLAVVGLYFLCMTECFTISKGDLIILTSNIFFALHIQLISKYVHEVKGIHLVCLEFFCSGLLCTICALLFEEPTFAQIQACSINAFFSGALGIGVCYALQVVAQKHTNPTMAALLMSLESVFAALSGIFFLHESFTGREFFGICFVVGAIIIAQLPSREKTSKKFACRKISKNN